MPIYREKDQHIRQEKKPRESSISKKRSESVDQRPIITQEKPSVSKSSRTSLKDKGKTSSEKPAVDKQKRKSGSLDDHRKTKALSKERKPLEQGSGPLKLKTNEAGESRIGKDSKLDGIYLKELIEKKRIRKSDFERITQEKLRGKPMRILPEGKPPKGGEGEEVKKKPRRDRTRTRTLSPTEIKQLMPLQTGFDVAGSGDFSLEMEKGGRAEEPQERGEDEDYEDDFEDYDSDFEEDDISESSPTPPSNSPKHEPRETEQQWKINFRKKEMEAVKRSIEKENLNLPHSMVKPNENDSDKENHSIRDPTSGVVDFSFACRRQKRTRKAAESRKRGEELLNMISLDTISYSILEIPPIPYEDFMKAFGKSNTKQAYVQTNEDNLDEEVQTEEITVTNKWTQNPPEYLGSRKPDSEISFILTKEERLGVGGDVPLEEEPVMQPKTNALWNFLSWASQLVLVALERKSGNFLNLDSMPNHSKAMAFGDGFVSLNVSDVPFLTGRSVSYLCLLSGSIGRLLSVHTTKEKSFQKCMICIWSLRELSKPLKVLVASNRVSSCCFGLNQGNLVFAGLTDGSICLWDLREPSVFHNRVTSQSCKCHEWSLQSPTFTTAGSLMDGGHSSSVVAVRLLSKVDVSSRFGDFTPMQICSLDEDGTIIIWSVVQLEKGRGIAPSEDLGLAHWGRVRLVKSSSFCIFASLREEIPGLYITCNDLLINEAEEDGFYVANSFGSVHHCSTYGAPMKPKFYVPSKQDAIIETTCLELCPFNGNYFLVGCGDGTIRLHSRHQENPLICLNSNVNDGKEAAVVSLSWMKMRPCVFFALDSLSRINIWDLGASDMYPDISLLLTQKKITCMKLLPVSDPRQVPFIVIGTADGSIEIHRLKKEFGCRTATEVKNEMKMFLKYVSIL